MDKENSQIRKASLSDLPDILEIEQACFGEDSFSKAQFVYLITHSHGAFYVVRDPGKCMAYVSLLFQSKTRNLRIYSIAVHPDFRNRKLGQSLIDQTLEFAKTCEASKVTLEVNVSNIAAIKLYQKNGFTIAGRKKNYYHDGSDAHYMIKLP